MKSKDQQLLEEAYLKIAEANLSRHAEEYEAKKKRLAELARKSNRTKEEDRELARGVGIPDTVDLDNWITTSSGFRGLPEPEGGWPDRPGKKKPSEAKPKAVKKAKEVEPEEDDFDVEGDPIGSFRTPDPNERVLFVGNKELEKIFRANESVFELLFKHEDLEGIEEKPGGDIEFRYRDLDTKKSLEQKIQDLLNTSGPGAPIRRPDHNRFSGAY
jgi:hypothetical protein